MAVVGRTGPIQPGEIGLDAVIHQRGHHDAVRIGLVNGIADLGSLAAFDIGIDGGVLGEHRAFREEGDRRGIDAFRQRARDAFRDDRLGLEIGERKADAIGVARAARHARIVDRGERPDQHDRRLCHGFGGEASDLEARIGALDEVDDAFFL